VLAEVGISHLGGGKGPRVHDLRHTFAVHSLIKMSREGIDLYYSLPVLSEYMGHKSLESTDTYVRLTSEMFPEVMEDVNAVTAYVFPEMVGER
jgi:integrase